MLANIKTLLMITGTAQDALLNLLISICTQELEEYTHQTSTYISTKCANIITQMVVERFNKLGSEGISSESNAAGSLAYTDGYSAGLKAQMLKHRKMVVV